MTDRQFLNALKYLLEPKVGVVMVSNDNIPQNTKFVLTFSRDYTEQYDKERYLKNFSELMVFISPEYRNSKTINNINIYNNFPVTVEFTLRVRVTNN